MPTLSHDRSEHPTVVAASSSSNWLTGRRIRSHAIILALCLWGACAVDFSTPGLCDRAGNIKFQDFLQFYISARLIRQHRTADLYKQQVADDQLRAIVRQPTGARLPTVYGPQVGLLFIQLSKLSFPAAARACDMNAVDQELARPVQPMPVTMTVFVSSRLISSRTMASSSNP